MNQYVTGTVIRELREKNKMTQFQLAEKLGQIFQVLLVHLVETTRIFILLFKHQMLME